MAAAIQPVITDAGLTAVWNATNTGMAAEIAEIGLGDGVWTAAEADPDTGILPDITALRAEKVRVAIAGGRRIDPHTIHVAGVADDATEFWLTEIAFYLADGTLFAVAVFPDRPLSYKAADTKHLFGFDLLLTALPANSVTIIAGAPDINLSVASDLAALAKADIDNMDRIVRLLQRMDDLENPADGDSRYVLTEAVGRENGVVPLNSQRKIEAIYLPANVVTSASLTQAIAQHREDPAAHSIYTTQGDMRTAIANAMTQHLEAADPHQQYVMETAMDRLRRRMKPRAYFLAQI